MALSVVVFVTIVLAVALFSGIRLPVENRQNNISESNEDKGIMQVMVIYCDDPTERYFACALSLDLHQNDVHTATVDCKGTEGNKSLSDIYKTDGFYPFLSACTQKVSTEQLPFVKLNSNTFVIIGDRLKKIVYNTKNNQQVLLTSRQAEQQLNAENFSSFCAQYAESALKKDIINEFLFIASVTENNLSYPRLYENLN